MDEYDKSPQGRQMIALLARHAPPPLDAARAREAVLRELPRPAGRLALLRVAGPGLAAAAAVVTAMILLLPPGEQTTSPDPGVAERTDPEPEADARPRSLVMPLDTPQPLFAVVRGPSGDGWRISAGLKHGLRVGDRLAAGDSEAVVTAAGIFESRVRADAPLRPGRRLLMEEPTNAARRAARYEPHGGDPGGLFDFGAVIEPAPIEVARAYGIGSGRALRVVETIPAILRDHDAEAAEPSLAGRAGLRPGDILVTVNGYDVGDLYELAQALAWTRRTGALHATVIRNGRLVELNVR